MDFFTVPTATFRVLYVLFVIRHGTREILHFNVTEYPKKGWVSQQMRDPFPWDETAEYLIFDRDSKFSTEVVGTLKSMDIEAVRTAYRCPWQNPVAERWIGSCRREMLDHVIVLNEAHLRALLSSYIDYYHEDRTHCGLEKATPRGRTATSRPSQAAKVFAFSRVGGLHHRYEWRRAA